MASDLHTIATEVRFLTTEEGGRRSPLASGYRGQFHLASEPEVPHDTIHRFPAYSGDRMVPLGIRTTAIIALYGDIWRDDLSQKVTIGTRFEIREGRKVVGRGTVTSTDAGPWERP